MSFFDEVETTVANTRFIQAGRDNQPVELDLPPIATLGYLDEELRKNYTNVRQMLQPKTFRRYLFTKFLKTLGFSHVCEWLTAVHTKYNLASEEGRPAIANELFDQYFTIKQMNGDLSIEEMDQEDAVDVVLNGIKNNSSDDGGGGVGGGSSKAKRNRVAPADYTDKTRTDEDDYKDEERLVEEDREVEIVQLATWLTSKAPGVVERVVKNMKRPKRDSFVEAEEAVYKLWEEDNMMARFQRSSLWEQFVQLNKYKDRAVCLDDFRIFRVLGRGAFGAVSAVQKLDTRAMYAMKQMNKKQVKCNESEGMCKWEKKALSKMNQPFVLNLKYAFHNESNLFLVFNMCSGGDLRYHLRDDNDERLSFEPKRAQFYAAEILLGLDHMHSNNIIYRDLKPNNILLDKDGHAKISDLGLTIEVYDGTQCKHLAGTAGYWGPEIVSKTGTFPMSDYWSFGVLIYEMLTGRIPKCHADKTKREWSPFFNGHDREMEKLALKKNTTLVLLSDKDYEKPKLQTQPDAVDLLKRIFVEHPKDRIGANGVEEIKKHPYFSGINWEALERLEIQPPFIPETNRVYANSIGEVGEFNKGKFKKIKLTAEDDKIYRNWDFVSEEGVQAELEDALYKLDNPPDNVNDYDVNDSSCCTIL